MVSLTWSLLHLNGIYRFPRTGMSAALNSLEERASPVVLVLGSVSAAPRTYSHSSQHLGRLPFSSLPALVNSVYSVAQPGEDLRKSMSCNSLAVEFLPSTHKVMGSIPNSNKMMGGRCCCFRVVSFLYTVQSGQQPPQHSPSLVPQWPGFNGKTSSPYLVLKVLSKLEAA